MVRNKLALVVLVLAFCMTAMVANASIVANLKLADSAGNSITLTDGGACVIVGAASCTLGGDLNPMTNAVGISATIGTWNINFTQGVTFPSATFGTMDVVSQNQTTAASTLNILFNITGMPGNGGKAVAEIGGTLASGTTGIYKVYFDNADTAFGLTTLVATVGPDGPGGPFSGSGGGVISATGPTYSLTQVVTLTAGQGGLSSFNASLRIPEPASMSLLGAGLIGLAGLVRRKLVK